MKTKKILVIFGHPSKKGFGGKLLKEYLRGLEKTNARVKVLYLSSLPLESHLKNKYTEELLLRGNLLKAQKNILWADHLVFFFPVWWATPPALLKTFLEVVLQRGVAYKYQKPLWGLIPRWKKLLKGRGARVIMTMDSPSPYYRLVIGDPAGKMMKANLKFCGVSPVESHYFGSVKLSSEKTKNSWLARAFEIGLNE